VLHPDFYGMKGVSKRAAFVVDRKGMVAYAWVAEDSGLMPPFEEILAAVTNAG
jgi:peroxiredoxin